MPTIFGGLLPEERQRPKIEMVGEDELPLGRDFCAMSIVQPAGTRLGIKLWRRSLRYFKITRISCEAQAM